MDVLAPLHGECLRLLSSLTQVHFAGLEQAARVCRARGIISGPLAKQLMRVDVSFNVLRHLTEVRAHSLRVQLVRDVSQHLLEDPPGEGSTAAGPKLGEGGDPAARACPGPGGSGADPAVKAGGDPAGRVCPDEGVPEQCVPAGPALWRAGHGEHPASCEGAGLSCEEQRWAHVQVMEKQVAITTSVREEMHAVVTESASAVQPQYEKWCWKQVLREARGTWTKPPTSSGVYWRFAKTRRRRALPADQAARLERARDGSRDEERKPDTKAGTTAASLLRAGLVFGDFGKVMMATASLAPQ